MQIPSIHLLTEWNRREWTWSSIGGTELAVTCQKKEEKIYKENGEWCDANRESMC